MASDIVEDQLLNRFPYQIHEVMSPSGDLVWVQKGINPDNVFDDKRRSEWPYSQVTADLICQEIVMGKALTQVCKMAGFPSYAVVCRWRKEHPEFNQHLEMAYQDRAEHYLEKLVDEVNTIKSDASFGGLKLKVQTLKWLAELFLNKKNRNVSEVFQFYIKS